MNEALSVVDALLHSAVEAVASAPPSTPADGQNWIVGDDATGDWEGRDGALACRQAGKWIFVPAHDGMRVLDRDAGQERFYLGGWRSAEIPVEPTGGSVVDVEARAAIAEVVVALRASGVFPVT